MVRHLEKDILVPSGLLALSQLEINLSGIVMGFSKWDEIPKVFHFTFAEAKIKSLITFYSDKELKEEPDHLQIPWDIIGVESKPLDDDFWRFVFVTNVLEIVFEAKWPEYDLSIYE